MHEGTFCLQQLLDFQNTLLLAITGMSVRQIYSIMFMIYLVVVTIIYRLFSFYIILLGHFIQCY